MGGRDNTTKNEARTVGRRHWAENLHLKKHCAAEQCKMRYCSHDPMLALEHTDSSHEPDHHCSQGTKWLMCASLASLLRNSCRASSRRSRVCLSTKDRSSQSLSVDRGGHCRPQRQAARRRYGSRHPRRRRCCCQGRVCCG